MAKLSIEDLATLKRRLIDMKGAAFSDPSGVPRWLLENVVKVLDASLGECIGMLRDVPKYPCGDEDCTHCKGEGFLPSDTGRWELCPFCCPADDPGVAAEVQAEFLRRKN
jgi:hypothetical protein